MRRVRLTREIQVVALEKLTRMEVAGSGARGMSTGVNGAAAARRWGAADPRSKVSVALAPVTVTATVDAGSTGSLKDRPLSSCGVGKARLIQPL